MAELRLCPVLEHYGRVSCSRLNSDGTCYSMIECEHKPDMEQAIISLRNQLDEAREFIRLFVGQLKSKTRYHSDGVAKVCADAKVYLAKLKEDGRIGQRGESP